MDGEGVVAENADADEPLGMREQDVACSPLPALPPCADPLPPGVPSPFVPVAAYEVLGSRADGCVEQGEVARSKRRRVEVEVTSPDDVVGRDGSWLGSRNARCDGGRGSESSSLQSSMTVRRLDWGLDSEPYS